MHITFSVPVKWLMDCLGVDVSILADNESSRLTKDLLIELLTRPLPDLDTLGEIYHALPDP